MTKIKISNKKQGKVTEKKFFRVFRKNKGSNSILCQFSRCYAHKRCSGIRQKLKEDSYFKCQVCANQRADIADDSASIELNDQCLGIVEEFSYLGDTKRARGTAVVNVKKEPVVYGEKSEIWCHSQPVEICTL